MNKYSLFRFSRIKWIVATLCTPDNKDRRDSFHVSGNKFSLPTKVLLFLFRYPVYTFVTLANAVFLLTFFLISFLRWKTQFMYAKSQGLKKVRNFPGWTIQVIQLFCTSNKIFALFVDEGLGSVFLSQRIICSRYAFNNFSPLSSRVQLCIVNECYWLFRFYVW